MNQSVYFFSELGAGCQHLAGGKGGTLTYLYQNSYPIPNGFIITPSAFQNDELTSEAWEQVRANLEKMRQDDGEVSFAVRSSALCEDSSMASFAGQFDTVLNIRTDDEVRQAVQKVYRSRESEEVRIYSRVKGINTTDGMAVVVQQMVAADISGVLFTADPVTGSRNRMTGNFVFGLGDKLVSGHSEASEFTLEKSSGIWGKVKYNGPPELKQIAGKLYQLGCQLEKHLNQPQDIEWSVVDKELYLLQSRPITTLTGFNPATGQWNDSMTGDYLWSNVNFGEAVPQPMTPLSWTVQQLIYGPWKILPGYESSGNIGGRPYLNISIFASVLRALGKNRNETLKFLEGTLYMRIPEEMDIPVIPLSFWSKICVIFNFIKIQLKQNKAVRKLPGYLDANPKWCEEMRERICKTKSKSELKSLWYEEIAPYLMMGVWNMMGSVTKFTDYVMKLRRDLTELVGPDDGNKLISGLSISSDVKDKSGLLASLGPVLGIAKAAIGEISRDEYMANYGHRGPNEFELSIPRPAEDTAWFDKQLEQFKKSPVDVEALLAKQRTELNAAWSRFEERFPRRVRKMRHRIDKVAPRARLREAVRSEYVRERWVARAFALRAGHLTGLGDDIFFLTLEEVLDALSDDVEAVEFIPARKETFRKYLSLPAYPSIINGRFNPFQWAADPNRRSDIYDAYASVAISANGSNDTEQDIKNELIFGSAGSAGRIEGVVRCLNNLDEGDQFQEGEVLVTSQTDITWTLLFPRAAAVVTDVGAPLSHAAVVARELGIPAVVGCGNATMLLKTGDRVIVDGGQGTVTVLECK